MAVGNPPAVQIHITHRIHLTSAQVLNQLQKTTSSREFFIAMPMKDMSSNNFSAVPHRIPSSEFRNSRLQSIHTFKFVSGTNVPSHQHRSATSC